MRNIAFLIADMNAGGAQRVASILCSYWAEQGHEVTLITFDAPEKRSFYALHENVDCQNLNLLGGSGNALKALPANLKRLIALRKIYKRTKPDVLVTFMSENNVLGILSAIALNLPVIVSERSDPNVIPEKKLWRFLRWLTYPMAKYVVCQTPKALGFFSNATNGVVIENPVLKPSNPYDPPVDFQPPEAFIAGLGRLGREKGFDILIDAFALVHQKYPDYHLVIIGEGSERKALEKQIKNLNLQDNICMPGAYSNPFSILSSASMFVFPSRFEGFPNALCEAMVHGLPVVITDNIAGSLRFLEDQKNCLISPYEDAEALSRSIIYLIEDKKNRATLATEAQKTMDHFDVSKIGKKWDDLISQSG